VASLTAFHYRAGNTMVHSLDTRVKLVLMALASLAILNASATALMLLSGIVVILCLAGHVHLLSAARELRFFSIVLVMVFAARVLSTPGEPLLQIGFLVVGKAGLIGGAIVCWRLLLVVVLGLVFISSTRISQIKHAVAWFFTPVPWVPEKRVATMLGLVVRFIPVIFIRAGDVAAAQNARCVGSRRNPFYRLKVFSVPMLRSVFRDAGNLAAAMEARCYSEDASRGLMKAAKSDWLVLISGGSLCVIAMIL